jgi:hydrogenase maturation protease
MLNKVITERIEAPVHRPSVVVLGVGNAHRHDDGVGVFVAQRVRREASNAVKVLDNMRDSVDLMEAWEDAETVIVVDAVSSGAKPGTIYKIEVGEHPLPEILCRYSSHNLSIGEAIGLSRALGTLPPRLLICGIEGTNFHLGSGLSPEVEVSAEKVVRIVMEQANIATDGRRTKPCMKRL